MNSTFDAELNDRLKSKSNTIFKRFTEHLEKVSPAMAAGLVAAGVGGMGAYAGISEVMELQNALSTQGPEAMNALLNARPDGVLDTIVRALDGTATKYQAMQGYSMLGLATLPGITALGVHLSKQFVSMKRQLSELHEQGLARPARAFTADKPAISGATRTVPREELEQRQQRQVQSAPSSEALKKVNELNSAASLTPSPADRFMASMDAMSKKLDERQAQVQATEPTQKPKGPRL